MQLINNFLTSVILSVMNLKEEREEGQGLVEYALIIALVSVVLVAALGFLADDIEGVFTDIGDTLNPPAP